jgi:hypothetical protein
MVACLALATWTTAAPIPAPIPTCVSVEISSGTSAAAATAKPRFSVSKTLDLTFTVLFPVSTSGQHVIELRVFTPDGQLYRSMAIPIVDGTRAATSRTVPGYPRPVAEKALARVTRGTTAYSAAAIPFPVGGTDIVSSGLYGQWKAQAHVDGADSPCVSAVAFTLNP